MTRSEILEMIQEDMDASLFPPSEPLTEETTFIEDLGMDALDMVEMIMGLEEVFDIEIPDEEAERWVTVGDAVGYVERELAS